jgi:hypothetical protein
MFHELGCNFTTSFNSMVTKFKHPTANYYVYAILDPCHMLKLLCSHLNAPTTSEFLSNILFYIGGYIVSKLVNKLSCSSCKTSLLAQFTTTTPDHDYCALNYSEVASASAFTLFVNNGGLQIPSGSVYAIAEYAEKVFKANVCNDDHKITRQERLKEKLVMKVCNQSLTPAIKFSTTTNKA